jgi:predicted transcriptional regulator of viral defense system
MSSLSARDEAVMALAHRQGILRARDLEAHGLARTYLRRLQDQGLLVAVGHGVYIPSDTDTTEHQTLIEVALRVPDGVVCLLSALRFHEIGTQNPFAVWLAIETGKRAPHLEYPLLEVVRQSGAAWSEGVETHQLRVGQGYVPVRMTIPAKTVADCFKFRSRVGQDVALEALRDVLHTRKTTVDELWHFAHINRVSRSMRPAMEAMLAQ